MRCWKCNGDIGEFDNYCRYCGIGQGGHVPFYYKIWGVWLVFLLLGPVSIYFVIRSPLIGKWAKWVFSFIMTALFGWFCYGFLIALKRVSDAYMSVFNIQIY